MVDRNVELIGLTRDQIEDEGMHCPNEFFKYVFSRMLDDEGKPVKGLDVDDIIEQYYKERKN